MFRGRSREFESLHGDGIVAISDGVRLSGSAEYRQTLRFSSEEQAEQAAAWLEEEIAEEREQAAGEVAEIDGRLAAAREAEQERVARAGSGENPFSNRNVQRVSDVEEDRQKQQGRLAALEASDVSRSGNAVTLVTRLTSEDLAGDEELRERVASEQIVSTVNHSLAWAQVQIADLFPDDAGDVTGAVSTPAEAPSETPSGNQQRVFEFTYDIQGYAGQESSGLNDEVESALLKVNSYVPESASVDVAQARISFQVTNGFENHSAVQHLRRAGLLLDELSVQEEDLLRVLPEGAPRVRTTQLELTIIAMRPGFPDRAAAAEEALGTARGFVPGSVVIDEDAMRFTAEFTTPPNPGQIASMLRAGAGLTLQSAGRTPAGGGTSGDAFYVSLYYESYTGDEPVGDVIREAVEGLAGYVADSLEHDEEAHYVTFQLSGVSRRVNLSGPLRFSGLMGYTYSAGSQPKPVEELKD